jgi:hypothetical protein
MTATIAAPPPKDLSELLASVTTAAGRERGQSVATIRNELGRLLKNEPADDAKKFAAAVRELEIDQARLQSHLDALKSYPNLAEAERAIDEREQANNLEVDEACKLVTRLHKEHYKALCRLKHAEGIQRLLPQERRELLAFKRWNPFLFDRDLQAAAKITSPGFTLEETARLESSPAWKQAITAKEMAEKKLKSS